LIDIILFAFYSASFIAKQRMKRKSPHKSIFVQSAIDYQVCWNFQ